ncbi:MAG: aminotransferase class I/II-fold pyridoxal phosphate-dependent enzyme [Oscillospiraceae bacterium]|jgi:LL-diaminopimelate aminotransferase|nr:aminotransferase class I/II-fold pyridoxal phosphate-dependent enzyme [Oscillospiraceae bacterium]
MPTFADRTHAFTSTNIFTILEAKRQERAAKNLPVFNLSVGTPDFPPAPHIMRTVEEAARNPDNYKYALSDAPELIAAAQAWYKRRYAVPLDSSEIMSVAGSQEGLVHIALAMLNHGESFLTPNPGYPIFSIGPALMGANQVLYELRPENNYLPDLDEIARTMPKNTRAMIASYPANPIGASTTLKFFEELVAFGKAHDIWIIHDNAYSDITYDGYVAGSFLEAKGAAEIGVEFNSLSKTYNLTGARISFLLGNAEFLRRFSAIRSQFDYGLCRIFQRAAIAALTGPQDAVVSQRAEYERRRDAVVNGLARIGWDKPTCNGTMFVWAKIPGGDIDDRKFVMDTIDRSGVIFIPGSEFGSLGRGYVRIALTLPVDQINKAMTALGRSQPMS